MRQGVESDQPLKSKAEAYGTKAQKYFSGQRRDFIDKLDLNSGRTMLRDRLQLRVNRFLRQRARKMRPLCRR